MSEYNHNNESHSPEERRVNTIDYDTFSGLYNPKVLAKYINADKIDNNSKAKNKDIIIMAIIVVLVGLMV